MELARRELNKYKSRQRILAASRRLFQEKGYEETMIEEVAEMAEISRATLYNYFSCKESLLLGIVEEEMNQIQTALEKQLALLQSSRDKLGKVLEILVLDSLKYAELARRIAYLNSCRESPLFNSYAGLLRLLKMLVLSAQREGGFKSTVPSDDIVDIYMSIYMMAVFQWRDLEQYPKEYCISKLERSLDCVLSSVRQ